MQINVNDEFSVLKKVIVASAETYFDHEAINDNQSYYYKYFPPSKDLLLKQQDQFFQTLDQNNIELIFASPLYDCPDQMNTRDPSFCIGNIMFISSMKESIRIAEKQGIKPIISLIESQVISLTDCTIEGGDVIVMGNKIYVGVSRRTTVEAIRLLESYLDNKHTVIPVYLKKGFLHLDTVFNILDEKTAICCPDALTLSSVELLEKDFSLIKITLDEQRCLGTNVLSIAPHKVISQFQNSRINEQLKNRKFEVLELDYSEAAKLGGAFRCATCPLIRE